MFGMIRYCRNVILSRSALSHCKRLCLVSVVLYSVVVGTLTWVSLTNFVLITGLFRNGFGKKRFAIDKIWMQSGLNRQKNSYEKLLQIIPVPHDTVQNTQDIVRNSIRYSRICHDIGTVVIRLD